MERRRLGYPTTRVMAAENSISRLTLTTDAVDKGCSKVLGVLPVLRRIFRISVTDSRNGSIPTSVAKAATDSLVAGTGISEIARSLLRVLVSGNQRREYLVDALQTPTLVDPTEAEGTMSFRTFLRFPHSS